jgi:hypothetical protein
MDNTPKPGEGVHTRIDANRLLVGNRQAKVLVHDSGLNVLGRCLKVLDLRRRDQDIDDAAFRGLALPQLELELVHNVVDFGGVGSDIDAVHLPVVVADLLCHRGGGRKAQRGESGTKKLHDDGWREMDRTAQDSG